MSLGDMMKMQQLAPSCLHWCITTIKMGLEPKIHEQSSFHETTLSFPMSAWEEWISRNSLPTASLWTPELMKKKKKTGRKITECWDFADLHKNSSKKETYLP